MAQRQLRSISGFFVGGLLLGCRTLTKGLRDFGVYFRSGFATLLAMIPAWLLEVLGFGRSVLHILSYG